MKIRKRRERHDGGSRRKMSEGKSLRRSGRLRCKPQQTSSSSSKEKGRQVELVGGCGIRRGPEQMMSNWMKITMRSTSGRR
jgi:hypothetical protein